MNDNKRVPLFIQFNQEKPPRLNVNHKALNRSTKKKPDDKTEKPIPSADSEKMVTLKFRKLERKQLKSKHRPEIVSKVVKPSDSEKKTSNILSDAVTLSDLSACVDFYGEELSGDLCLRIPNQLAIGFQENLPSQTEMFFKEWLPKEERLKIERDQKQKLDKKVNKAKYNVNRTKRFELTPSEHESNVEPIEVRNAEARLKKSMDNAEKQSQIVKNLEDELYPSPPLEKQNLNPELSPLPSRKDVSNTEEMVSLAPFITPTSNTITRSFSWDFFPPSNSPSGISTVEIVRIKDSSSEEEVTTLGHWK